MGATTLERIEWIYQEGFAAFCRLATSITGDIESARDAVQDGFADALARHGQYRGEEPLEAWLWRIVVRRALDRRRASRASLEERGPDDGAVELWVPELPHPEHDAELDLALRALPARQRQVVFLRYFADLSHAEIAAFTGMQLGTVSATLHQAKASLAGRLAPAGASTKKLQR